MRRTALAVLLAASFALPPAAGNAADAASGICSISGRVDYSPNVKSLPAPLSFTVGGTLTCLENLRVGTSGFQLNSLVGFFQATGSGSIGCIASQGMGNFTMGISTSVEATTRELWEGTFRNAGLATQALVASIATVKKQNLVNNVWQTASTTQTSSSQASGPFMFGIETDDVTTCAGAGIPQRSFIGNLSYSFTLP